MKRLLSWIAACILCAGAAMAQPAPNMLPTVVTAAGTYPATAIPVTPSNTAVVELQATGTGSGLSFKLQGIPIGSSTPVDLTLLTAPDCAASTASGTANGDWFANVSGFSRVQLVVTTITGSETFGITNSAQANCASTGGSAAASGSATAANQATQITAEQTTATGTGAPADAAYSGSGSSSIIAALKGIYAKLGSVLSFVLGTATYTDTVKPLTAATDTTLLAATANLKSVCLMNIGLNPATITNGASAAVVGNGQAINPASATGFQGSGYCYPLPPTNAIHAISTLGTTIIVTVGQ